MTWRNPGVEIKTPEQIAGMRRAGLVVGRTLEMLQGLARPGLTTGELDAAAQRHIEQLGAQPSFLGYHGFTGSICASVNDEVVHGVPGARVLQPGDLVSIDCGAIVDGWHGDAAVTFSLGEPSPEVAALMDVTRDSLWHGIAAARLGGRVGDISTAVEQHVRAAGDYGIVEDYTGHGIGSEMHQEPDVPNLAPRRRRDQGPRLVEGLALAIEPMITLGTAETTELDDEWTVVTDDGSWAAHFEHTMTVTTDGVWVLTALDGGREHLGALGVAYGGD
ncbi:type I methionyl aminopeptidase [Nocardioides sp. R-C-SC26]|uniref:type I methionyl aminopeptidase n=1 Tax=Nocardioides sp. R-C-SC26 TaxID=2870414 RepID=UPI001E421B28|nr:type I methionyl aminopeptidase [Nocardioides sp. R-C-SC26]